MKPNYFNTILNCLKLFLGMALILIPLSISILIISYPNKGFLMLSDSLGALRFFFGAESSGGASNTPIMFGLMVLSGVLLLNKVNFTSARKQNAA